MIKRSSNGSGTDGQSVDHQIGQILYPHIATMGQQTGTQSSLTRTLKRKQAEEPYVDHSKQYLSLIGWGCPHSVLGRRKILRTGESLWTYPGQRVVQ